MVLRGWGVRGVVAGVVAVLAAGCTGGGEAEVTPTPSVTVPVIESPEPSPSPTPSPTPTALTKEEILAGLPPAATEPGFWGAQEFARYFLQNYHDILRTNPELFVSLSSDGCTFCERTYKFFEEAREQEISIEGGTVTVTSQLAKGGQQEDGTWAVVFDVETEVLVERDSSGEVISEAAGGMGAATLLLEFDGHWSVMEVAAERK